MRNSFFFNKRPNSLIKTWLGERKPRRPGQKTTNKLFQHKSKTLRGRTVRTKG